MVNCIYLNRTGRKKERPCLINNESGFSLVELMVVVAIASMMLAAMYGLFITLSRSYTTEEVKADAMQDVRAALNFMIRDIRMAGLDPKRTDKFGIEEANSTKILFTSDLNSDGVIDDEGGTAPLNQERVTYLFDLANNQLDQVLYEGTGSQSNQPVLDNVIALNFSYLNSLGTTAATNSEIREVHVQLTVRLPAGQVGSVDRTLESSTQCRNLYF